MIPTADLITALSANLTPVQRLRPPLLRASLWIMLSLVVLALVAMSQGFRPDIMQMMNNYGFFARALSSLATGLLSAVAAFMLVVPGRSRYWALLPLPAFAVWMVTAGPQCFTHWIHRGPDGMSLGESAQCFATIGLTSLPIAFAMLLMLRRVGPLYPMRVTLLGGLAVAGIGATALSLAHTADASAMVLAINMGAALLLCAIGPVAGQPGSGDA